MMKHSIMIKRANWIFILAVAIFFRTTAPALAENADAATTQQIPAKGLVTMVDLGAHKCIPCKMMAPIIAELQKEYDGRASIVFIDVWENRDQAQKYGISGIPTQIFYDKKGKEVSRHLGFLDKKSIVEMFDKLGVPKGKE